MQSNRLGRHRKPRPTLGARAAVSAGAAVAAVLVSAGGAAAAPADTTGSAPTVNPIPCTGTPFDNLTKGVTGDYCGTGG